MRVSFKDMVELWLNHADWYCPALKVHSRIIWPSTQTAWPTTGFTQCHVRAVDDDVDSTFDRFHKVRTCECCVDDCQYLVTSIVVVVINSSTAELTELLQVEYGQQRVARCLGVQQLYQPQGIQEAQLSAEKVRI